MEAASANLTSITITPANPSVPINTVAQLTATGQLQRRQHGRSDFDNHLEFVLAPRHDQLHGHRERDCRRPSTITATLNTVSASVTVAVTAPSIVSISVSPDGLTEPMGITQQFTATALYSDGSSQDLSVGCVDFL